MYTTLSEKYKDPKSNCDFFEYCAGVVHDFTNIFASIIGFADIILHGQDYKKYAVEVKKAAFSGVNVTKRFMDFFKNREISVNVISIARMFDDIHMRLIQLAGNDVQCNIDIDPDVYNVLIDESQLERVIMNLMMNARHAVIENGLIEVKAYNVDVKPKLNKFENYIHANKDMNIKSGQYAVIEVKDNGKGIAEEIGSKVFQKFFTTKNNEDHLQKGHGIGLASAYQIINQASGYLCFKSMPGQTNFCILLPRHEVLKAQVVPKNARILLSVVDKKNSITLKDFLIKIGYNVYEIPSCQDALSYFDENPHEVEIIVTDSAYLINKAIMIKSNLKILLIPGKKIGRIMSSGVHKIKKPFNWQQIIGALES